MPLEECIPCVSREEGPSTPGRAAREHPGGQGAEAAGRGQLRAEPILGFLQERQGRPSEQFRVDSRK